MVEISDALLGGLGCLSHVRSMMVPSAVECGHSLRGMPHSRALRGRHQALGLMRSLGRVLQHVLYVRRHVEEVLHEGSLRCITGVLRKNLVHADVEVLCLLHCRMVWE